MQCGGKVGQLSSYPSKLAHVVISSSPPTNSAVLLMFIMTTSFFFLDALIVQLFQLLSSSLI
jgi:hypothetical protein